MLTLDVDLELIFGIPYRAIDVEININDNWVPEASNHLDDSPITNEENEVLSPSTSRVNVEGEWNLTHGQVEGEHLNYPSHIERALVTS